MKKFSAALAALLLAILVSGCGSVIGDADAGPDPGAAITMGQT
jgi:uncharacterized protein YceK